MKEEKSASESTRRMDLPEKVRESLRKTRGSRPAPRTDVTVAIPQAGETQQLLNGILADEFVTYVRTLNFHWNVRGMQLTKVQRAPQWFTWKARRR